MSDFAQFYEGRGGVRITKANDVRVLADAKELLRESEARSSLRKVRMFQGSVDFEFITPTSILFFPILSCKRTD
jgi:hypothetical protein